MNRKFMLIAVVLLSAGCHDDDHDQISKLESELRDQREKTGEWMVVAGVVGIGGTILFGIGTAIGSKARKQVRKDD